MDQIWFEEELVPTTEWMEQRVDLIIKGEKTTRGEARKKVDEAARGILRVEQPRWEKLETSSYPLLTSGTSSRYVLVRLGFEFDLPEAREQRDHFTYALCSAHIWAEAGPVEPSVYDVFPRELYDGEPRQVTVKISPEIKLGEASGVLGELSSDLTIGTVEPVVVGYPGTEERVPYWKLRPKSKALIGTRYFWMVLEIPESTDSVRVAAQAECDLQTRLGPIPLGPKIRDWASRRSIVIRLS